MPDEYDDIVAAASGTPRVRQPRVSHLDDLNSFARENKLTPGSTTGGTHNKGSKHPSGNAMDIKGSGAFDDATVSTLKVRASERGLLLRDERVRPPRQKVWGGPHVHIEVPDDYQNPYDAVVQQAEVPTPRRRESGTVSPDVAELAAVGRAAAPREEVTPQAGGAGAEAGAPQQAAAAPPTGNVSLSTNDASWHFGMLPEQARRLTRRQYRVLSEAVAEDERKKASGQSIGPPSLRYQNEMREKAGLKPLNFNMAAKRRFKVGTFEMDVPNSEDATSPYYRPEVGSLPIMTADGKPLENRGGFMLPQQNLAQEAAQRARAGSLQDAVAVERRRKLIEQETAARERQLNSGTISPEWRDYQPSHGFRYFTKEAVAADVDERMRREGDPGVAIAREQRVAKMGWGEYLAQAPKSVALGFADAGATGLKSIAVLAKKLDNVMGTKDYEGKKTSDLATYQLGQEISDGARYLLGSDPGLEQEFWVGQSPQTIGQVASFMLGGWASKSPKLATVILGMGMTAGDAYDEVIQSGGTDDQAVNAGLLAGGLLGPTELIGMQGAMHALEGKVLANTWKAALKEALREGRRDIIENTLQEMGQEWGQGIITGNQRSLGQIFQAGALGAVGGTMTIPLSVVRAAPIKETRPLETAPDVVDKPDEAPVELPDGPRPIVPEGPSAIVAQMDALVNRRGNRMAVLVPKGQSAPSKIPKGYRTTRTSEGVIVHPREYSSADVRELVDAGEAWRLLGHANPDTPEATRIVIARAGQEGAGGIQAGDELWSSYVTPGHEQEVVEEARAQFAPYKPTFEVGGKETAERVVSERSGTGNVGSDVQPVATASTEPVAAVAEPTIRQEGKQWIVEIPTQSGSTTTTVDTEAEAKQILARARERQPTENRGWRPGMPIQEGPRVPLGETSAEANLQLGEREVRRADLPPGSTVLPETSRREREGVAEVAPADARAEAERRRTQRGERLSGQGQAGTATVRDMRNDGGRLEADRGLQQTPDREMALQAPSPRFEGLGNQQIEQYIANTRERATKRIAELEERSRKGTPRAEREARPRVLERTRRRSAERIAEAEAELARRRQGTEDIPSFETWLETEAGGTAGGTRVETLSPTERSTLLARYDEQYHPRPHHSTLQPRRQRGPKKGQFAPGKPELPGEHGTVAPAAAVGATDAAPPWETGEAAPAGQLFAKSAVPAVREPTADEAAALKEPTVAVKPLERQNALRSYLGNKITMARAGAFNIIPESWRDKWKRVVDVFGGSGVHGWQIGKALGKPVHYNELDPDVYSFQQLASTNEGQEKLRRVWGPIVDEIAKFRHAAPDGGSDTHREVSKWWKDTTDRLRAADASPEERATRILLENTLGTMGNTQALMSVDHKWKKDIGALADVSSLLDRHKLNAQMWESTSNKKAEDLLTETKPGELVILDPPYASTKGYAVGNEHGSVNGAVNFIDTSIAPAAKRGVSILYTNSAHLPIVESLRNAGLEIRIERVQTQNARSGAGTLAFRYEVTAWTPDVSPPRGTDPEVLRGLISSAADVSQRDLTGQTPDELWNTLISTAEKQTTLQREEAAKPQRGSVEFARTAAEHQRSTAVREIAEEVTREEAPRLRGEERDREAKVKDIIRRNNDELTSVIMRVEDATQRDALRKEIPPFTRESLWPAVEKYIGQAVAPPTAKAVEEPAATGPYTPQEGELVSWKEGDVDVTGKVLKIMPSGAYKMRVSGRTAGERRVRLPKETAFTPATTVVRATPGGQRGRPRLDPTIHSLERAIRSQGGVTDDGSGKVAMLKESGKPGLVVTQGGRTVEDMAMNLAEMGYGFGVWWEGSQRAGAGTFTGVDGDKFLDAATEDAAGSRKHYSTEYEPDISSEEEAYWRSQMTPEDVAQFDATQKFLSSTKVNRLLQEITDGQGTAQHERQLRELGKARGLEDDVIAEHIRLAKTAQEQATARDSETPHEALEAKEEAGPASEGHPLVETREPLFKRDTGQPEIVESKRGLPGDLGLGKDVMTSTEAGMGSEGVGLYVTKSDTLAHFFASGEGGKVETVRHGKPRNPLVVDEEPLPILQESDELMEPVSANDSEWMRLNKQARINAKVTDDNWGQSQEKLATELTRLIRAAGYDAVEVTSGDDQWTVLLDPKLIPKSLGGELDAVAAQKQAASQLSPQRKTVKPEHQVSDEAISLMESDEGGKLWEKVVNGTASRAETKRFRETAKNFDVSDTEIAGFIAEVEPKMVQRARARQEQRKIAREAGIRQMHMGADPYELIDNVIVRGYELYNTKIKPTFEEWAKRLKEEFGSKVSDDQLQTAWAQVTEKPKKQTAVDRLREVAQNRGQKISDYVPARSETPATTAAAPATVPGGAPEQAKAQAPPRPPSKPGERSFPKSAERAGFIGGTDRDYHVLTDAAALEAADRRIAKLGQGRAAAELAQTDEPGKEGIATGLLLMQRFEKAGQLERAVGVANDLARKLTRAGQEVQAASIVARLSPEGVLLAAQRQMKAGRDVPIETARVLVEQARAISDAEKLVAELQRLRPDVFGPNGEILPQPKAVTQRDSAAAPVTRRGARARVGKLQDRLAVMEQQARARMEARAGKSSSTLGMSLNPAVAADLGDLVMIGAAKIARSGISHAVWMAEMAKEATALTKRDLRQIYKESYAMYEAERKKFLQESRTRGAERYAEKEGIAGPLTQADYRRIVNERLDAQTAARKARLALARTFRDLNANWVKQSARRVRDVWNLSRSMITSVDFSAAGRQGKMGLPTHPISWLRGFARQFRGLSTKQYERMMSEMEADPDFKYAQRFKLYLAGYGTHEEAFESDLVQHIPWIKHSEQAYNTMLNTLRMGWFKAQLEMARRAGLDPEGPDLKEQFIRDTSLINNFTGRGGGRFVNQVSPITNTLAFSTRFWASRLKVLTLPLDPRMYGLGENAYSKTARVDAWKTVFGFYGLVAAQMGLAYLAGAQIGLDPEDWENYVFNPDSADFLKARFGKVHVDFTAGQQTHLRVAARLAMTFYKREFQKGKPRKGPGEILRDYGRSKLAPNPALLYDLFLSDKKNTETGPRGTDYAGQPVYLLGKKGEGTIARIRSSALAQRVIPIVIQDAMEAYKEGISAPQFTGASLASIFGEGVTTYSKNYTERGEKLPMAKELESHGVTLNPPQRIKPGKYESFKAETDAEYDARRKAEVEAVKIELQRLEGMSYYKKLGKQDQEKELKAAIAAGRAAARENTPAAKRKAEAQP